CTSYGGNERFVLQPVPALPIAREMPNSSPLRAAWYACAPFSPSAGVCCATLLITSRKAPSAARTVTRNIAVTSENPDCRRAFMTASRCIRHVHLVKQRDAFTVSREREAHHEQAGTARVAGVVIEPAFHHVVCQQDAAGGDRRRRRLRGEVTVTGCAIQPAAGTRVARCAF